MTAELGPRPALVLEPPCPGCRRPWEPPITHCAWCHRCFDTPTTFDAHQAGGYCADSLSQFCVGTRRFHLTSVVGVGDVWVLR